MINIGQSEQGLKTSLKLLLRNSWQWCREKDTLSKQKTEQYWERICISQNKVSELQYQAHDADVEGGRRWSHSWDRCWTHILCGQNKTTLLQQYTYLLLMFPLHPCIFPPSSRTWFGADIYRRAGTVIHLLILCLHSSLPILLTVWCSIQGSGESGTLRRGR